MYYAFNSTEFRSGKAPILIATDVASRGLGMSPQHTVDAMKSAHLTISPFFIFMQWIFFCK